MSAYVLADLQHWLKYARAADLMTLSREDVEQLLAEVDYATRIARQGAVALGGEA